MAICSFKCLLYRLFLLVLFFLIVVFAPGLPPDGTFTAIKVAPVRKMEGPLALNTKLNNAEHIFKDKVKGAEGFAEWNGELYTSIHGGEVVKLSKAGHVTHVVKFGHPCEGYWQEAKCGRPLGLAFDSKGMLFVMDAYYGIWKVDVSSGKKQLLVSPNVEIEGKKPKIFNSIALASNGDFYWTDSSSTVGLEDGVMTMLVDGNGRLLHYNAAKNSSSVLLDGLWFANGVALSPNEDFVVVSETAKGQIRRFYLRGPKEETDDIFIDGLIGLPDNLKPIEGGLLVPLVSPRDESHPVLFQSIAPHPLLRKFLARILALIELPFTAAQKVLPHYAFERTKHVIGHFESVQALVPKRTSVIRLDWNGNVIESWHNTDGSLSGISEAHIFENSLYLGSPYNNYIGRVPLPSDMKPILAQKKSQATNKQATPKPTEVPTVKQSQAQKPKPAETTTPEPTTAKPTEAPVPKTKPTEAPTQKTTQAPKTKPTEAATPKPKEQEPIKEKKVETPKQAAPKPKQEKKEAPKPKDEAKPKKADKPTATPIVEEIPSDTRQPREETLKVIKSDGPQEIPNPSNKESKTAKPQKNEL